MIPFDSVSAASRTASRLLIAAAAISLTTTGCSDRAPDQPELGQVSGTVTLDGIPLSGVSVYFKPEVGRPSIATADAMGNYEAMYLIDQKGVKVGPNTVSVEWGIDESGPPIPPRYGQKSELKLDVQPGDNRFDIKMSSEDEE